MLGLQNMVKAEGLAKIHGRNTTSGFFGMVERGSLDCVLKPVHSSRSRALLLPLIDGWKSYIKLSENVSLEDTLHFAVNHTNNYVDPITGTHTQSIEGTWNLCKNFLPSCGVKPKNLDSYLNRNFFFIL